ncbi:MAG: glycosyltransferase [Bacteroidales bacterium]|nr:glycosyltransferase [Bacteroidales bacterium]
MAGVFVSYIVPCYNIQAYLPKCLESLHKQQIPEGDVEFVLVNDGSTDGTLAILQQFAAQDSRVTVLDQSNQGVCAARNHGLAVARGTYVFFLDGDDWLTDDASEVMYRFCRESQPDIVLFNNYKIPEGQAEGEVWIDCTRHIAAGIYPQNAYLEKTTYFPISFKLYRRTFLLEHQIRFDEQLVAGELYTFFIHALVRAQTVGISPGFVMYYLKRKSGSATTAISVDRDDAVIDTLHVVNGYVRRFCPQLQEKRAYLASSFWLATSFSVIKYVGRTRYRKEIGQLMGRVRADEDYQSLLRYFTGKGFSLSKHTALALSIRFLPPRAAYFLIRQYYKFATRKNSD